MRVFPRSLFGRNALLIVLLIAAGQLGSALLLRQMVLKPRIDQIAEGVARNLGAIRAGLMALPPQQRPAFVEGFNRQALASRADRARRIEGAMPGEGPRMLLTPIERGFVHAVSVRMAQLGVDAVWRREPDGGLALRLMLDGSEHWIVMPGLLPSREFTGALVAVSLGSALLALVGALWLQRRFNRPLARVVEAARSLAGGREPPPLPEDGPTEVATVSRSFNQLVGSLRRSERERALMLAGVSHDLRTPLTKLRLGVEILRERMEPELASSMTRSVEEMDAIVGQFLDFARGDEAEPMVPADLAALAGEVRAARRDHGETLEVEGGGLPPVPLRPQAMRRAMGNLVENAFRHGRPPVRLVLGSDARQVWFEVIDHGDGIARDAAEALKQPFRRAGGARNGPAGAGLGLAIVERIARSHDGRLELLPAEGGGLRARVVLPRTPAA